MAIRNIVLEGEPILYKKCREVENFDNRLSTLIDDMIDTMKNSGGVGLAAPQVGILKRVLVIDVGDGVIELVNPEIVESSGEQREEEGCLSCPGFYAKTLRPMCVTVKGKNRHGKEVKCSGTALKARAFCHEIDHLDGILFKSRIV
ncbi:MAG: peptide deformylase [Clostridia bacterium]|nr:peptide deformylase [Clostridia bacterium]